MKFKQQHLSYGLITRIVLLLYQPLAVFSYPTSYNDEIVIVKEFFLVNSTSLISDNQTLLCENQSNETINNADDLIIPIKIDASAADDDSMAMIFTTTIDSFIDQEIEPKMSINMSAFLALIPTANVKTIVNNYYQRDIEVQEAVDFLQSEQFDQLKQHFLNTTEMIDLLIYFKNNGIELLKLVQILSSQLTVNPTGTEKLLPNENKISTEETLPTGLEAMIETLLETLPQDLILSTFFEKLENDEQFYRLVNNIGSEEFSQICYNLQHSKELERFFYTLKTKGVNLKKILIMLKDYIFMGTF